MLERNVLIDGHVYCTHKLTRLNMKIGSSIGAMVTSYDAEGQSVTRVLALPWEDGISTEDAETQLWELPEFAEWSDSAALLDEVLQILTDEQASTVPDAFQMWTVDTAYAVGDRRRYDSKLYRCVQAHTSQRGWEPPKVPALWVAISEPGTIPEWVQPTGAHDAYSEGDHVMHVGKEWVSTADNNTWEPGVYGWEEA